jgi:hypothetical protein
MKYLKKFENFDLHGEEELRPTAYDMALDEEEEETQPYDMYEEEEEEDEFEDEAPQEEITLEKKKAKGLPPWLKKGKKDEDKKDDKKEGKKTEEKGGKGLSAKQKKLPEGLRKAIEARKKK